VRVNFTLSPTGSSLPPPSSIKELQSQKDCHQAPIRKTSEPYSSSGLLHTRNEFGHNCQAIHRATLFLPQRRKPRKCASRSSVHVAPKKAAAFLDTRRRPRPRSVGVFYSEESPIVPQLFCPVSLIGHSHRVSRGRRATTSTRTSPQRRQRLEPSLTEICERCRLRTKPAIYLPKIGQ